jgi:hypothetical protein
MDKPVKYMGTGHAFANANATGAHTNAPRMRDTTPHCGLLMAPAQEIRRCGILNAS